MPSIWTIEMEYARVLASFGSLKAALDVYLRWEMWDDVITAYTLLGQSNLAEKCIRERITSGDETPDLYCSLGDVTKDPAHYEKAWELSNHKSARAMKSLGLRSLTVEKDPSKAAEYLEKSLLINRFQIDLWFTLGCCYLQLKNFPKAETAFRTCVSLEPDNFEAWNNLASAVIFSGRKAAALELLKEATKWNYESWRVWENILLASIDVSAFGDTIRAFHRLIDLRQKYLDPQILGILVRAVCEDTPDKEGCGASKYRKKLLELMGRATSTAPSDADTWRHYATLLLDDYDQSKPSVFQRAVQCLQKSYQCRLKNAQSGWELVAKARFAAITDLRALNKLLLSEKEAICGEEVTKKEEVVTATGDETPTTAGTETTSSNLVQLAFLHSSLSTLRLNINSLMSRLKKAGDCCVDPTVSSDLNRDIETLREMLSAVTTVLNDLPPV
uniref:Tetratricopeptide repeat protein 27 n=2 Tax=Schistocephalus solidus TaxID=70667 RepID=A0A0V0J599_SCHSO